MLKNIILAIKAYFSAFRLISKLKLWKFFTIPMLISLVTGVVVYRLAYTLSDNIGAFISKIWIWDWGHDTFSSISNFIGGLIILVLGLIFFKHIIMALSAPFMSPVSEKIEAHLTGKPSHTHRDTNFMQQLSRGIRINARNLILELFLTLPLLLLKFIPIINIFSTILLVMVQSYYAGFGNMDYTLERHFQYKESVQFVVKNRGLAIGNGVIFILLLLVPIVGVILVLPLSVTAASIITVETLQHKKQINNV